MTQISTISSWSSSPVVSVSNTKQLLASKGVDYEEIRVDGEPAIRAEMTRKAGRTSVPQIWIGSTHVGGCDDLYALERAGKLDALLQNPA